VADRFAGYALAAMRLDQVLPAAAGVDVQISGLAYDNRLAGPGTLFFCVPGFTRDGHEFAADAVARGAAALVVERELELPVPQVRVESVRAAMAPPRPRSTAIRPPSWTSSGSPARTARRRPRSWSGSCWRSPGAGPACSGPSSR
jgi:hypothetical protein